MVSSLHANAAVAAAILLQEHQREVMEENKAIEAENHALRIQLAEAIKKIAEIEEVLHPTPPVTSNGFYFRKDIQVITGKTKSVKRYTLQDISGGTIFIFPRNIVSDKKIMDLDMVKVFERDSDGFFHPIK